MTDLCDLTAGQLLRAFAARTASPTEVVEACLARVGEVDGTLNAVLVLLAEDARRRAQDSERRWREGTARPLEGVPYGLKDIVATAGVRTTGGSELYRTYVPVEDAAFAARLSAAGGVLLAKLHTFEFACGGADNRTFGPCRNPWDTARTTGGSSSGSGAAVAAGELPVAIGTDTAGSIRIPAAYCGLTGLKPTYGRVPRHGVMGLSWSLDHAGPMTRSVEDAALVLQVVAGHDRRDPTSSSRPVPDYVPQLAQPARGRVVGRPRGWFEEGLDPDMAAAFDRAVEELTATGARVVDVALPDVALWDVATHQIMLAEMLSLHADHAAHVEDRDAMGAGMLAAAPYVHAADYLRSLRYRRVAQQQLQDAMCGLDALVTPAASSVAPELSAISSPEDSAAWLLSATRMSTAFNYTGSPALCVPTGLVGGMPVGLQLVGRPHDEATLFSLGAAYQTVTSHHTARPARLSPPVAA